MSCSSKPHGSRVTRETFLARREGLPEIRGLVDSWRLKERASWRVKLVLTHLMLIILDLEVV